jgi:hypothetical protein
MNARERVFSARYRAGVVFAPGPGCVIAPLLFVPGVWLFKNMLLAAVAAIGCLAVATLLWTRRRKMAPALVLARSGMSLEGLGLTRWSDIAGVRRVTDALGRPALELDLKRRAPRALRSPLWRATRPNAIVIHASLLEDPIPTIEDAFRFFLDEQRA